MVEIGEEEGEEVVGRDGRGLMSFWQKKRRGIRKGRKGVVGVIGGRKIGIGMIVAGILGERDMIVGGTVDEIAEEIEMGIGRGTGSVIVDADPSSAFPFSLISTSFPKIIDVVS